MEMCFKETDQVKFQLLYTLFEKKNRSICWYYVLEHGSIFVF